MEITENKPIRRKDFFIARSFYFPRSEFFSERRPAALGHGSLRAAGRRAGAVAGADPFAAFAVGDRIKPQCSFADRI